MKKVRKANTGSVPGVLLCPLGLKGRRLLKTRNRALPPQTCPFGYLGMSVNSAYKVVCGFCLKKIHQVLAEQQVKLRKISSNQQKIMPGSCSSWNIAE